MLADSLGIRTLPLRKTSGPSNPINKAYLVVGASALLLLEIRFRFIKLLYPSFVRDENVGDERVLPTNEA